MTSANPASSEMAFFSVLARCGSFSGAARELNLSPAAVSKRLAQLEARLGVSLLKRTTRRVGLTPEGDTYLLHARRILVDIEDMERLVANAVAAPKGLLRVNATQGFGRSHVAPLISRFAKDHPEVQVELQLTVDPPPLGEDAYDVGIRFGEPPDARVIARKIATHRRLLCASPAYLTQHGTPKTPHDLTRHNCIGIRQGHDGYGIWRLRSGRQSETVKVRGSLSSSDGEVAVNWALEGHGIVMRAEWDVARYLRSGRLHQILAQWETPSADIHVVYPQQRQTSARVRAFVDFLVRHFENAGLQGARPRLPW